MNTLRILKRPMMSLITIMASLLFMRTQTSGSFVNAFAVNTPITPMRAIGRASSHGSVRRSAKLSVENPSVQIGDVMSDVDVLDASTVSVAIERTFPNTSPHKALNSWMEYHWKRGGGLPILVQSIQSTFGDGQTFERTIYPVLMKENLVLDQYAENASVIELEYIVSETGPFYQDIIDNSHSASVVFTSNHMNGCDMTWTVKFSTKRWTEFYKAMAEFLVGTSANTLQEVLATPRVFKMKTNIDCDMDPTLVRNEWFEFIWMKGGGLLLPPAIPYGKTIEGTSSRRNLLRIPPLITESIVDTFASEKSTGFEYSLNSPGWLTFPFLMHSHKAVVEFTSNNDNSITIDWLVEIRPYKATAPLVEKLVEMVVSTLLRNLKVRLNEPGATISIKPPRGNTDLLMGRKDFGSVPKETWIGGVLDAHLTDQRSTMEQSLAMLQPWTWGRTGDGGDSDDVNFQWLEEASY